MQTSPKFRLSVIPILARSFFAPLFVTTLFLSSGVRAEVPIATASTALRESDVVRLAREQAPGAIVARATESWAKSQRQAAGLLPNPNLVWARESVNTGPEGARGSQDLFGINVPIDGARPGTERALAASQSAWSRTEASLSRTDAILRAVLLYYDVVVAEKRVDVLSRAVDNLEEAARVLERREEVGSVSGYERARLSIESELSRSRLAEGSALWEGERARLAVLLDRRPETLHVDADLSLMTTAKEKTLARSTGSERAAVVRARDSAEFAEDAKDRAGWAWLPRLEVSGGLKRANGFQSDDGFGYFVGANVSLPLFDRGQAQRLQADAEQELVSAKRAALSRDIASDIQTALVTYRRARDELERFEQSVSGQVDELLKAARSGYREGERSIVELVDAQRAQTEVALRRLALRAWAKQAEVRLRSASGELQ